MRIFGLAFVFVAVLVVVYRPILVTSRRLLQQHSRAPLAILGALLFPVPMLAFPLLQERLEAVARLLLNHPVALVLHALPYVVAGAMLGWLLSAPRQDVRQGA